MAKKFKSGDVIITRYDCYIHKDADYVKREFYTENSRAIENIVSRRQIPYLISQSRWHTNNAEIIPKGTVAIVRDYDDVFMSDFEIIRHDKSSPLPKGDIIKLKTQSYDNRIVIYALNKPQKHAIIVIDGKLAWIKQSTLFERAEDNDRRFKSAAIEIKIKYEFKQQNIKDVMKNIEKKLQTMNNVSHASSCTLSGLEINVDDSKSIVIDISKNIEEQLKQCVKTSE